MINGHEKEDNCVSNEEILNYSIHSTSMRMIYRIPMKISILLLFLFLTGMPASAQIFDNVTTCSIVHLSDTQYLASRYPETYDYTFSYLDSIKDHYNISAIIITGDLVETWNDKKQWEAYSHAVHKTSIPVYAIAGNHDTNGGNDFTYYTQDTGNRRYSHVTSFENFDLVEINYAIQPREFDIPPKILSDSSNNLTVIASHDYMDENGTLSLPGKCNQPAAGCQTHHRFIRSCKGCFCQGQGSRTVRGDRGPD